MEIRKVLCFFRYETKAGAVWSPDMKEECNMVLVEIWVDNNGDFHVVKQEMNDIYEFGDNWSKSHWQITRSVNPLRHTTTKGN